MDWSDGGIAVFTVLWTWSFDQDTLAPFSVAAALVEIRVWLVGLIWIVKRIFFS